MSRRNLTAAVLRAGDAGAEEAARIVPEGAVDIKVGGAVLGYEVGRRKGRYSAGQLQALGRLRSIKELLEWRAEAGEEPAARDMGRILSTLADAARFFAAPSRYALSEIRSWVPDAWRDLIADNLVGAAMDSEPYDRDRIMSPAEAGRALGLRLIEVYAIESESGGRLFPLIAVDETVEERARRRAIREREMDTALKRRKRSADRVAECCNPVRISFSRKGDPDNRATLQSDAVRAAVDGGAARVQEIAEAAGLPLSTVRPILSRLVQTSAVVRAGRGRYAAARCGAPPHGPEAEPHEHAPALSAAGAASPIPHSDLTTQAKPREAACGARPEVGRRLAEAAALHPRQPAFSRLPGRLFLIINRRTDDAAHFCTR